MAAVRELRRLFEAISKKDWDTAHSVAEHLADEEGRRGNRAAARSLRDSLHYGNGMAPMPTSILELGLSRRTSAKMLGDVVLPSRVQKDLRLVIEEFRHSVQLQSAGFPTRRKLIFTGPPGCGKSLTAQVLANELGIPHFVVRFDAIIGSFLGQTAMHLRQLFRFAEATPSVLLFDEIDALGKRRGNPTEVGELDRIVIALMQELELTNPAGLVIATSNIPQHLDHALWRRFDAQLLFPAPTKPQLKAFVSEAAARFKKKVPASIVSQAVNKSSYAEAEKVVTGYLLHETLSHLNGNNGRH